MRTPALLCSSVLLAVACGNVPPAYHPTTGTSGSGVTGTTSGQNGPTGTGNGTTGQSCTNQCTLNDTQCSGTLIQSCNRGINGCTAWSSGISCLNGGTCVGNTCQGGSSTTTSGTTGSSCTNPCPADGATQCIGPQVQICHQSSGCLAWSISETCPTGEACGGPNSTCVEGGSNTTGTTSGPSSTGTLTSGTTIGTTTGGSTTTSGQVCTNQCMSGGTQCSSGQVQTCGTGLDGCLEWQEPEDCPSGESCDPVLNACESQCSVTQTQSTCTSAANKINQCCAGGIAQVNGDDLCTQEVSMGSDPNAACQALANESCAELSNTYMQMDACCCPAGQFCDEETPNWTCEPVCSSDASCSSVSGRTSCCPNDDDGQFATMSTNFICKADDAAAFHGCSGVTEDCSSPYDCWSVSGDEFCTLSCNQDSDCNDPNACCDTNGPSCSNEFESCNSNSTANCGFDTNCNGTCLPCGSF